jgi:hypothetical protein
MDERADAVEIAVSRASRLPARAPGGDFGRMPA